MEFTTSERELALLVNALHKDEGVNLEKNPHLILTKTKVHKAKKMRLGELSSEPIPVPRALFSDGKNYDTLVHEIYGESSHRNTVKRMPHIVVADAERLSFVGEFIPKSGTMGFLNLCKEHGVDLR
jgi:Flp pilus assembly CpaE family ATPase